MAHRVVIQWTETAKKQLAELEPKVRRGLLDKANLLRECDDPRLAHKPLTGPLEGYYRITYARYRAVYSVEDEKLANENTLSYIRILFVAVGKRKEHDRKDVYRLAQKLIDLGILQERENDDEGQEGFPRSR